MSVYVGIDVHRKRSQVAVVTGDGKVQLNKNVVNGSEPILRLIGDLPPGTPVAFKAAFGWGWLAGLLEDYGFGAHLVHPLRCKAIASARLKNDKGRRRHLGAAAPRRPAPGSVDRPAGAPGTRTRPLTSQNRKPAFLALEDLPPLTGVKLVRPRRYAAGGRSSLTPPARRQTGQQRGRSRRTVGPSPAARVVTGPGPYALLTVVALIGAADRVGRCKRGTRLDRLRGQPTVRGNKPLKDRGRLGIRHAERPESPCVCAMRRHPAGLVAAAVLSCNP